MATVWNFDEWFDTVKGQFGVYGDAAKRSLIELGFTTELSLSLLELSDLNRSDLPLGQQKALYSVTRPFREKGRGRSFFLIEFSLSSYTINITPRLISNNVAATPLLYISIIYFVVVPPPSHLVHCVR
jgi:hypothetical protein